MDSLNFEQQLRLECFKLTGDINKAQVAYDFIIGPNMEAEDTDDPMRFNTKWPFTMNIRDANLTTRTVNLLHAAGIETVGDLVGWPRGYVMRLHQCGKKSFREMESLLERLGLSWSMWESPTCHYYHPKYEE